MTKTIMLVHGAWLNAKSWEHWRARYEAKGYAVLAPDWPGDEGDPADLRANRPTRSHWTCAEPGWEEVADFALDWAVRTQRGQT